MEGQIRELKARHAKVVVDKHEALDSLRLQLDSADKQVVVDDDCKNLKRIHDKMLIDNEMELKNLRS